MSTQKDLDDKEDNDIQIDHHTEPDGKIKHDGDDDDSVFIDEQQTTEDDINLLLNINQNFINDENPSPQRHSTKPGGNRGSEIQERPIENNKSVHPENETNTKTNCIARVGAQVITGIGIDITDDDNEQVSDDHEESQNEENNRRGSTFEVELIYDAEVVEPIYKQRNFKIAIGATVFVFILILTATLAITLAIGNHNKNNDQESSSSNEGFLSSISPTASPTDVSQVAPTLVLETERFALTQIYNASTSANDNNSCWSTQTDWLSETVNHCFWYGVTCDYNTRRVTRLNLPYNGLCGSMPSEIGLLHDLDYLDVSGNEMTGSLPSELFSLDMSGIIHLSLMQNDFSGELPSEFYSMHETLEYVNFRETRISGTLSTEIGLFKNLHYLYFDKVSLTGTLPSEIGHLTELKQIIFEGNNFSGTLPTEIGNMKHLEWLDFLGCDLSGTVPTEIGLLSSLKYLNLMENNFENGLPPEICSLENLSYLFITTNRKLGGTFPEGLLKINSMLEIGMGECGLIGSLPSSIGEFQSNITYIDLAQNSLTGTLPSEIGLLDKLEAFLIDDNDISGTLPSELGNLQSLQSLFFFGNRSISGTIPDEICELVDDEVLQYLVGTCTVCAGGCCRVCLNSF